MAKPLKIKISVDEDRKQLELSHASWWGWKMAQSFWKTLGSF